MNFEAERQLVCQVSRAVWEKGMVAANDGNVSLRLPDGNILCTPTGVSKGFLTPEMLPIVDLKNNLVEAAPDGVHQPTSEVLMHLRMYEVNPEIGGCVHAHPMYGTVFAVKGEALTKKMMPESVLAMPEIPLAPYGTPSTSAVPDSTEPFAFKYSACLLEQHGAFSWGKDVMSAYLAMERLEYTAKLTFLARLIGGERELPEDEVQKLIGMRAQYGL